MVRDKLDIKGPSRLDEFISFISTTDQLSTKSLHPNYSAKLLPPPSTIARMKAFAIVAALSTLGVVAAIPVRPFPSRVESTSDDLRQTAKAGPNALKERSPDALVHPAAEPLLMDKRQDDDGGIEPAKTAVYWCYGNCPPGCAKVN